MRIMKPGNIVLVDLLQSDGNYKLRPALVLKKLPKYNDFLICGISTQVHQYIKDYDEILYQQDNYFSLTGLQKTSLVRLFFLAVASEKRIAGSIGKIQETLHKDLLQRLSMFIVS